MPRCHLRTSVGRTTLRSKYLDDSVTQVYRAERVEKRVDAGVDVGQPERGREQLLIDELWTNEAHVVDDVERHPADDVPDDEERQRHEALAFSIELSLSHLM